MIIMIYKEPKLIKYIEPAIDDNDNNGYNYELDRTRNKKSYKTSIRRKREIGNSNNDSKRK